MMNRFLIILSFYLSIISLAHAQINLVGHVSDASGNRLAGVTISEKGVLNNVTTSNTTGDFQLQVANQESVLLFSVLGYGSREIIVGTQSTIEVQLIESEDLLDEVIVTGYSSQKRGQVTAAITTISSEDLLKNPASHSTANLLQGKAAGVDVAIQTGRPGAMPTVRIRGRSSISSQTDALWVVDGIIIHGTPDINPNDVETMSVLKDGAATSQYGSRGVNGVIVVTTKQAREIGTSQLRANFRTGVSYFNADNFRVLNAQELYNQFSEFSNQAAVPTIPVEVLSNEFDWLKNGTQAGRLDEYHLTYSGKTEKAAIYASGNYYKEEGAVKGFVYDRFAGRLNVDYAISDRLLFKPKVNMTYNSRDNREHSLYDMYMNMPWDNPYAANGAIINPRRQGGTWYGRDAINYLYDLQYNYDQSNSFDIQSNIDFEYRINKHFTFISSNNVSFFNSDRTIYVDPDSDNGLADNGRLTNEGEKRIVRFTNQMLRYRNQIDKHRIQAFTAIEYNDYGFQNVSATGRGLVPGSTILDIVSTPQSIGGRREEYAFQSIMLQGEYSHDERYNLQASLRRDGSSRFGRDNRYGTFFAISGAWNVHNELFFKAEAIDFLRLRTSYGQVGNVPTSLYASQSLFSLNSQYAGTPGGTMDQLGNSNVSWETSSDINIGFEIGFLQRFNMTMELYDSNTNGLLQFITFPSTAGWQGYWDNIGAVRNRGLELSFGAALLPATSAFQWQMDFNIAFNRNKITALYNNQDIPAGLLRRSIGRDIDSYFMRKWAGVDPQNGDPLWEQIDSETGEITLTNNYNQATLQFQDKTGTPNYQGGITSSMQYKSFYLNAIVSFTQGAWAYNAGRQLFDSDGAYPYYNQMALQEDWSRWTPENPDATHPRLIYNSQNASNGVSSRFLEDASLIRLRNVTFGYRLPQALTSKLRVSAINVFVSGDNVWSATKFSGLDPEGTLAAATNRNPNNDGDSTAQYPVPKRLLFGLNISF